MAELAQKATDNGDATDYTYGSTPNDRFTWDAEKVRGCYCDDGYTGYDCSLEACLYGDDARTTKQNNEVQSFTCAASSSSAYFTLSFRQATTTPLYPSSTASNVQSALEALSTITEVSVASDSTAICTAAGNTVTVTFLTETGDLPLLQYALMSVDSFAVEEDTKGTREYEECSGRGVCDTATGECSCFTGYGSSDKKGGKGTYNDCGYKEPIIASSSSSSS
jgi:hypothetical protein